MYSISLRLVVVVLLLLVSGGLVAIVMVGGQNAIDGVEDVCRNLRIKVSDSVTAEVVQIMTIPFTGMERAVALTETGAFNAERWDARDHYIKDSLDHMVYHFQLIARTKGWGSNLYISNDYGSILVWYSSGMIGSSPPLDQVIEGNPTWTAPCRYQSNCTHPSNAANHKYCVNQSDPFAEYGSVWPEWASGKGQQKSLGAYYTQADPSWATWAVPQHPTSGSPTHCRPGAQGAKFVCPDGSGCPETNFTYHSIDALGGTTPLRGFQHFDPRMRWWYGDTKALPPQTKYYNAVKLCLTTLTPCLTASMPLHVEVPSVGAVVRTQDGRLGSVLRYVHTVEEMHTPVVAMEGGEEVWGRRKLSLACNSSAECEPMQIPVAPQTTTWKFYGVIASDYFSKALADIGFSFKVSKTGGVFIGDYTPEAKLLTSGFPCPSTYVPNVDKMNCFIRTVDGKTDLVSAFDPYAGDVVSGVMKELFHPVQVGGVWQSAEHMGVTADLDETVSFGGSDYWVRFVPLSPRMGDITNLNWFVCVVIPQDDYLEDIKKNQMVTLIVSLCLVAVVLAMLLGMTLLFVVRPVMLLLADFDKASVMELESIEERSGGVVSEFATLQQTFNKVVHNLRLYRPFLPHGCFGGAAPDVQEDETVESTLSTRHDGTSMSERSSGAVSDSIGMQKAGLACHMASHLRRNIVTVVSASIDGFHALVREGSSERVRALHADLLTRMLCAAGRRCSAEPFTGDRMRFTWNSLATCRNSTAPFIAACQLADVSVDGGHPMLVGVAKGEALCGTMGTDSMKNFCVVGSCHSRSLLVMALSSHYGTPRRILVDNDSAMCLSESEYEVSFVEAVRLSAGISEDDDRTLLWTIKRRECAKEEWMYMISAGLTDREEWLMFLSGRHPEHHYENERILHLQGKGVNGGEYCGQAPHIGVLEAL